MAESKEELKSLLMKVKEESEKAGLKLSIQKTNIMASGPITSWQIDVETMETVTDFIFLGSKSLQIVTAAMKLKDAYSLEEKLWCWRRLLRNLHAGQEATVRITHGTTDWFQNGKGVLQIGICKGCILSPYFFNLYA